MTVFGSRTCRRGVRRARLHILRLLRTMHRRIEVVRAIGGGLGIEIVAVVIGHMLTHGQVS